jgi:drug/metabolite transporter (DMT)-like permease
VAVVLGLLAAIAYGASDFIGGHTSTRVSPWPVLVWGQLVALVGMLIALPFLPGHVSGSTLMWGLLAGVGSGIGSIALYHGLSSARMNVVAPLSGVVAAALPVLVGLATGDRPHALALSGVALALGAIVLVSLTRAEDEPGRSSGVVEGLVAGLGFALLFIGLQRPGSKAGAWPLLLAEIAAVSVIFGAALGTGQPIRLVRHAFSGTAAAGVLAFAATLLYLISTRHGLLSIVAVLVSLYPALTVILAAVVLRERSTRLQVAGMLGAALSVALIALN